IEKTIWVTLSALLSEAVIIQAHVCSVRSHIIKVELDHFRRVARSVVIQIQIDRCDESRGIISTTSGARD
ncbi:MAG: hypothetical protein SNF60_04830, partial [Rikenellaceae bacterium]